MHKLFPLLLYLLSGSTFAGVIYEWQMASPSSSIHSIVGRMEVTDEAYASHGASYTSPFCEYWPSFTCTGDPTSPILSFYFAVIGPFSDAWGAFSYHPQQMVEKPYNDSAGQYWLKTSLVFQPDGLMSGSIFASNAGSIVNMSGNSLWTIYTYGSDAGGPHGSCNSNGYYPGNCNGATGYWRRVPEPPAPLLLTIGLLALMSIRRRKGD
jgi:hypothetical protein